MDEVSNLNRKFEERTDEFLSAIRSCFSQAAYYNPQKASHNQSVLMDVRQHLKSLIHQQMDLFESNSQKLRV